MAIQTVYAPIFSFVPTPSGLFQQPKQDSARAHPCLRTDIIRPRPGDLPSLGMACILNDTRVYERVEAQHHLTPHRSGKPVLHLPARRLSVHHLPARHLLMDFFFNLFAAAPAETRAELDSEVVQVPVDFDGTSPGMSCIVA